MWDQDADGYARGDGVATVVLKTLSQALKDGDHIECLIRESGVNQGKQSTTNKCQAFKRGRELESYLRIWNIQSSKNKPLR